MEETEARKQQQQQHIASSSGQVVVTAVGVDDSEMGGNRSGSTSSTAGLVVGDFGGGGDSSKTPPQSSKRDSGYHTDCSPALFSTAVPHFTFPDTADTRLATEVATSTGMRGGESYPAPPTSMATLPLPRGSLSPGWQPQRVLPEVSDDDDDDDAFVSESVMLAAGRSAWQSRQGRVSRAGTGARLGHGLTSADDTTDGKGDNRGVTRLGHVSEETEDRDDSLGDESACSPRRRRDHLSSSLSRDDVVRRRVTDGDGGDEKSEEGDEDVATTDYHHAPLSWMSLPSGDRIRPLIARTIATQTPHLHCQLIDQILDCPQGVPGCARGSAVRRLRYYSEGEETVGQSSLPHGPLPDLVPVTHVTRERSLSAPDLETLQRQRLAAREVGRELRRISDEFLHTYNARADNRDGAVAALHAELNGVAAFFLTGVRRFMYRGFAGYFRHVFNWTRRAMNSAVYTPDSSVDEQR